MVCKESLLRSAEARRYNGRISSGRAMVGGGSEGPIRVGRHVLLAPARHFRCDAGLGGIPYDFLHLAIWRPEAELGDAVEQAGA